MSESKAFKDFEDRIEGILLIFQAGDIVIEELGYNIGCAVFDLKKALGIENDLKYGGNTE